MGFSDDLRAVPALFSRAAQEQGGILSGANPVIVDTTDPIRLWVIQVIIIISMTQLLALALGRIRQPRVVAEVIGGIVLGPTVMGRIPGFRKTIFPDAAMPLLNLTATIGLVLFLFLVGLEIDTRIMRRNIRASTAVSVAGLVIPLGLGAALGVGVYKEFIDPSVNFGYFILFTAVAIGITAFPVLCRILTELQLLDSPVGIVTLSAGVGNDVIGWVLLALSVALVNASTGLTALYVLLTCVAFVIFLLFPVRWGYVWLCRRTGSLERGTPTPFLMTVTLLMVFACAFFTDVIGVHAIFGGFLAGLVIPHDNGFAISLVEKIEDLVSILLLPIYFTLSGLKTNLGALDNGITWGYTILICLVAFTSKFVACAAAAYATGFNWRESTAIGSLMSCKGLVELIVLNIGLQAGILNTRVFSMFVVHALILTFATTPLTLAFYPPRHRNISGRLPAKDGEKESIEDGSDDMKTRFSLVLDKIEQVSAAMTLAQLIHPTGPSSPDRPGITIDALRLIELTNRTSAVLKSQEADSLLRADPMMSILRTYGHLHNLSVSSTLSVVAFDEFSDAVASHAQSSDSQMVLVPWCPSGNTDDSTLVAHDPFEGMFNEHSHSIVYSEFVRNVFLNASANVGLFVDRGVHSSNNGQHIFLPFFGGPDDRLALKFVVQLCNNSNISSTVVRIAPTESDELTPTTSNSSGAKSPVEAARHDTVYAHHDTHTRLASNTADDLLWGRFSSKDADLPAGISFKTRNSATPLHAVIDIAQEELTALAGSTNLLIVLGRSRRLAALSHQVELKQLIQAKKSDIGSTVPKTLGDVGAALVATKTDASLLIVQAHASSREV